MLLILLILTISLSYAGTFAIIKFGKEKNILDVPNVRSLHKVSTPKGGGLAVAAVWFAVVIIFRLLNELPDTLFYALICGVPVSIISLIDDFVYVTPKIRLFVQIICAILAVFLLGGIRSIDLGIAIMNSSVIFDFIAVIGIVWFTNIFNFIDGIDGYLGTEIIFICLVIYFLVGSVLPLFLAAATAGFLIWNWQPAKIFMGDVGSTLLGFTIAIFIIHFQNNNVPSVINYLMLSSLFWFDATTTLIRRIINKENIFVPHKKHAYQRIVQYGFSHKKTVVIAMMINLIISIFVLLSIIFPKQLLIFFLLNLILLTVILKNIDSKFPFKEKIFRNKVD